MLRNHVECHKTDKISTAGFLKGETTLQEKKKQTGCPFWRSGFMKDR